MSVLDLGIRTPGDNPAQSVADAIALAQLAEALGFARYWVGEHHSYFSAWAQPEIVTALIAAQTHKIRVGSAGVLLRVQEPVRVASDYSLLSHLFRGRIDLGIARGTPLFKFHIAQRIDATHDDTETNRVPRPASDPELHFRLRTAALLEYLAPTSTASRDAPHATPHPSAFVQPWLLGTGTVAGTLAGELGIAFATSLFHRADTAGSLDAVRAYRASFLPSPWLGAPRVGVAVAGLVAATKTAAERTAGEYRGLFSHNPVVGTPSECARRLRDLRTEFTADEVAFTILAHPLETRVACLRGLAEAF